MKLYRLLGFVLSPLALAAMYVFSFLTGTRRARVVVTNENGEVLLLKTWLGAGKWGLPGGGMKRGEKPEAAAVRELREETGLAISTDELVLLTTIRSRGHEEIVFTATTLKSSLPVASPARFEVEAMAWVPVQGAKTIDSLTRRIFAEMAKAS